MPRAVLILTLALSLCACAPAPSQASYGVAIYLPVQAMSGRDILLKDITTLVLQPEALIPASEIISYSVSSHDLVLAPAGIDRLAALKVPVQGLGFVFCEGETPLVAGALWTPISSLSFEGLTLNVPFDSQETSVHLYSGYPMLDVPAVNDPRNDTRLLDAFRRAGKLR